MSGARFVVLRGQLARLERALGNFMLDVHTGTFGYQEVVPPLLVRDQAMYGTAQLPKFREEQFGTTNGYWLIPTAEVSLTNQVREQILDESAIADALYRLDAVFPFRGGRGRQRHARHDPHASVFEGGAGLDHDAGAVGWRTRAHDVVRRGNSQTPGVAVPHDGVVDGRHGLCGAQDLRHRGLAARAKQPIARFQAARTAATFRRGGWRRAIGLRRARGRNSFTR